MYDKRSEMEKFMGIKTGEENYVLDLQTKKEFNGTLMTSVAAGKGNNKKKEAELISNFFKQRQPPSQCSGELPEKVRKEDTP